MPVFVLMAVFGFYNGQVGANATAQTRRPAADIERSLSSKKRRRTRCGPRPSARSRRRPSTARRDRAAGEQRAGFLAEHQKPYSLVYTYSLIIALVCGTAGLPHILVRFYTNPDGVAAKRTTMWVMILIGVFYVFPPIFGVLGAT